MHIFILSSEVQIPFESSAFESHFEDSLCLLSRQERAVFLASQWALA
ncbi:hypothetical protein HAT2_00682 [Candidatus Similichlamydia laticola]|uniref:Uncharacterized protein n=1 Tax=Candidatus Similichlamydia laticola TaxID=2170265 RepID=A0A369KC77_9BACT|nr:hypothetical protein HAT2_00682 [Candidatus Similichlamydia laticola]